MTERVVAGEELDGLADMIAGILRGNLEANPALHARIDGAHGVVALRAPDVQAGAALAFGDGTVRVTNAPARKPHVEIVADSEQMMAFSTVPLRMGLPDVLTPEGRVLTKQIITGKVKVRGMVRHIGLVRRLQALLSVS
jgi:hypothetical protein